MNILYTIVNNAKLMAIVFSSGVLLGGGTMFFIMKGIMKHREKRLKVEAKLTQNESIKEQRRRIYSMPIIG